MVIITLYLNEALYFYYICWFYNNVLELDLQKKLNMIASKPVFQTAPVEQVLTEQFIIDGNSECVAWRKIGLFGEKTNYLENFWVT